LARGTVLFILIFGLFVLPVWPDKDQAAEGPKRLRSLSQLIDMAIANSPQMRETLSDVAVAESDLDQAKAAYYPQMDGTILVGPVKDAKEPGIRNNRIEDPSPGTSLSTTGIFGKFDLTVSQPLYTFGKISNRNTAAGWGLQAARVSVKQSQNEIVLQVSRLYYALVLSRGGIEAADEAEGFFSDLRSLITRLLDLDSPNVEETDIYRIDAYQADTRRSRAEAEKGQQVATFALKYMIGISPESPLDVKVKNLSVNENQLPDIEYYIRSALSGRPEMQQLDAALSAKKYLLAAAKSDRYPSFFMAFQGSVAGAPGRDELDNPYILDEFNHAYAGIVLGMQWHYDFGILAGRVGQSLAEYNKLLYSKKNAEMNIPIQVASVYHEVQEWKKAANLYEAGSIAARKWVVAALSDFQMGIGKADDILKAIEKYGDNQGKYLEALFNYHVSLAELNYATGMTGDTHQSSPE